MKLKGKKPKLEEWHQEGREKTGNFCEVCRLWFPDEMLCGHHVFSQKAYPQWRLHPKNRLMVCQQCHNKIHSGKVKIDKDNYRPEA